jgi:UDP-N-acetylmuramoylalanine--D-glutamate ligase
MARWLARARRARARGRQPRRAAAAPIAMRATARCRHLYGVRSSGELRRCVDLLASAPACRWRRPVLQPSRAVCRRGRRRALRAARSQRRPRQQGLAITGSNGKSTVTAWPGDVRAPRVSRRSWPATSACRCSMRSREWRSSRRTRRCLVLELSSFQLETTQSLRADGAACSISPRTTSTATTAWPSYAAAKARIFAGAACRCSTATMLEHGDARPAGRTVRHVRPRRAAPPDRTGASWPMRGDAWLAQGAQRSCRWRWGCRAAQRGQCARGLALCARSAAARADARGAARFAACRIACSRRARSRRRFYDDSKGTNVGATVAALSGMGKPVRADRRRRRQGAGLLAARAAGARARARRGADRPRRAR